MRCDVSVYEKALNIQVYHIVAEGEIRNISKLYFWRSVVKAFYVVNVLKFWPS